MQAAEWTRTHPFVVICDEAGSQVGDVAGVSFIALGAFLPSRGDRILLEDGRTCEMKRTYFKLVRCDDGEGAEAVVLVPSVYAVAVGEE
jgi:hypothetical protein